MRLLVVEDEQRLAAGLRKGLEAEGFAVDVVHNGTDGIWMARENPFDAIIPADRLVTQLGLPLVSSPLEAAGKLAANMKRAKITSSRIHRGSSTFRSR